jgi:prepilin-type N-terminal cleavage/methylation domain-containing protein
MCKKSGFTLIELLTVISITVLLMAILLPVVQSVKKRARDTLCQSNLRQWGIVYKMYTDEFDDKLPRDYGEFAWYYPIRSYYSDTPELLLCPSAKKPSDIDGTDASPPFGGTFLAWGRFAPEGELAWDRFGSYGLNHWAYEPDSPKGEEPEEAEPEDDEQPMLQPGIGVPPPPLVKIKLHLHSTASLKSPKSPLLCRRI